MDSKISNLASAVTLTDADVLPIVNGAETKKVTVAVLKSQIPVNADWNATTGKAQILNKPTIPSAQVNSDWSATSGVAQILNKPTIPTAVTQTSQLTNNGADGVNPFITALDIPVAGQASTLVREVKNMTGATLTKGTVVYISGANGNKALVSKALATTDALSSRTFGMLQSDILDNGLGNCVIIGDITGLNTSSFTEGAQLYLSGVTAGTYTASKILAPTHLVYVGKVTRVHPTLGQIEVGIQNGYELSEIHDVAISTPINNNALVYESATDLWKNKTLIINDIALQSTENAYSSDYTESVFIDLYDSVSLKQDKYIEQNSFYANPYDFGTDVTAQPYRSYTNQIYTSTIVWGPTGSAPTGTTAHTYSLSQVGNLVTLIINLSYGTAGAATLSTVACELPSTAPTPAVPSSATTTGDVINYGTGMIISAKGVATTTASFCALRLKSTAPNVFEVVVSRSAAAYRYAYITIQYFV